MAETPIRTGSAGRPRSREADEAIADATIRLLAEGGYERLTIEAVSQRAGVGRPVIYRRFRNKTDLVIAVIARVAAEKTGRHEGLGPRAPRTGNLRGDIGELFLALEASFNALADAGIVPAFLGELMASPDLAARFFREYLDVAQEALREVFREAAERGEAPSGDVPEDVISLITGTYIYHRFVVAQAFGDAERERAAGIIADGVAARTSW